MRLHQHWVFQTSVWLTCFSKVGDGSKCGQVKQKKSPGKQHKTSLDFKAMVALKIDFSHSCRSSEFWPEIISMNIIYVCVEYFLFSRTCKYLFFIGNNLCWRQNLLELVDHNWSMYAWRRFPSGKQVFWRLRQLLPYGFGSSRSRLRKLLLSQELRRFAYR